jgi:hypothetical protein
MKGTHFTYFFMTRLARTVAGKSIKFKRPFSRERCSLL